MADVAAVAGVSAQTVSRVVNDSPRVDPATRANVEAAMSQLGYRMHRAARALRTGRTDTIGLIVANLSSVGNSRMLQALADHAAERGFALTVVTASGREAVADAFARLSDQGIDGAVILNEATALARGLDVPPGLALVVVDSPADDRFAVVQTDHAAGARAATEHLLSLGRGSVHHLGGPVGSFAAAERERGWRDAHEAAGIAAPEPIRGDWTSASGHAVIAPLAGEVTALFAANDQMALGALRAFAEAGRTVPDDVAVIGFDDVEDAAEYSPPLTTVKQDFDELGAAAVASLVTLIGRGEAAPVVLTPHLVPRASA
ncbi:LacI family DNA-binding transcriptional regulator [Microbacterium memoriense]|uniref:LacI family DNA-binding transcriptional regulator n=2 Tax=Microbacterium memoriense TaxID=2978350 RepID=A0ABT2PEY1_9MICO|nr:LacI family DNA-binding transcriptional regulator [Microbacterium memoriense]MCT9002438.1 LacI family DNA-binding transcriptional regulator [Microbacterium memoriense]